MLHKIFHLKLFFDFLEYCEACFRGFAFFCATRIYIFKNAIRIYLPYKSFSYNFATLMNEMAMLEPGIKGYQEETVTEDKLATNVGSGKVRVYATPRMIALIEKTAALSVENRLEMGQSSVGTLVSVSHCAATPLGMRVHAETELVEIDRRRLVFSVKAYDECGLIGEGRHERFIIDIDRFQDKTDSKLKQE